MQHMRLHLRVLQFLLLIARVYAPATGNGVTTGCTQTTACSPGCYGTGDGNCYQCGAGFWKSLTGTTLCRECWYNAGEYAGSNCLTCTWYSQCTCNKGYLGPDGGPCLACASGTYKDTTGSGGCTNCGVGFWTSSSGKRLATDCKSCPAGSGASCIDTCGTSSGCTCNIGLTGPNNGLDALACLACVAGTYKSMPGSAACTTCAAGLYSTSTGATTATTCVLCPGNSNSPNASSACTCNAGFSGQDGGMCTVCAADTFKNTSGSAACTPCSRGTSAVAGSSVCVCDAGYGVV